MLISSLCEFYRKVLCKRKDFISGGYVETIVHYRVLLSPGGEIMDIIPLCSSKGEPQKRVFPFRTQSTHPDVNFPETRPDYLFGMEYAGGKLSVTERVRERHSYFVERTKEFFSGSLGSTLIDAYLRFAENWNPNEETDNIFLKSVGGRFNKVYFEIALYGDMERLLQCDEELIRLWDIRCAEDDSNSLGIGTCSVYGEKLPIARIHDKIYFPGGSETGNKLVCVNKPSLVSYGMCQGESASVSVRAMKEYTAALNYLLHTRGYNMKIGRMVFVYFALAEPSEEITYLQFFNIFIGNKVFGKEYYENDDSDGARKSALGRVSGVLRAIREGKLPNIISTNSGGAEFCLFGLVPNGPRISVRFEYRNCFGELIKNVESYLNDFGGTDPPSFLRMAHELTPPALRCGHDNVLDPDMAGGMLRAMVEGSPFPFKLLYNMMLRVRIDRNTDENRHVKFNMARDAVIIACLNRNYFYEENKLKMSLDKENRNRAYLCGRLFAVLERIQERAGIEDDYSRVIEEVYFNSSCSRPGTELIKLYELTTKYMGRLSKKDKVYFDKLLDEIFEMFDQGLPDMLSLVEQAEFVMGYRHQHASFFVKTDEHEDVDEEMTEE